MKNVLVLSGSASATNYIRSLGGDPSIRLVITDSDRFCPGLYAPGIVPIWVPRARDTAAYRSTLDRIVKERSIEVLIPTSDYDVEAVTEYLNDGWSPPVRLFRPPYAAFSVLSHKRRLMDALAQHFPGNIPRTTSSPSEGRRFTFPVVVKPAAESGGKGVAIVREARELESHIERARRLYGDDYLIQEFVPGRTYVVTLVYDQSARPITSVTMRSHLTMFTWGGGGCAGELVDEPEMNRIAAEFIAAAGGWCGPINLEMRRHSETGAPYLMEANCRLNGYSYLTTMNGLDLPRVVLHLLTGDPLPPLAPCPPERRRNFIIGNREMLITDWIEPQR